jgi:hypothetical protein
MRTKSTACRRGGVLAGLLVTALLVSGCAGAGRSDPAHRSPVPLPSPTSSRQEISEANLAYLWPLTVDHGTIECRPPSVAVFVTPDGTTYALNRQAEDAGYPPITPLRAKGAGGGYISLGALLSATLGLCGKG